MAFEQLAAAALRLTQVSTRTGAPGDDLASLDSTEMPNGALALVADTLGLYILDKTSSATAVGAAVVAAIGGGRWIAASIGNEVPMGTFVMTLNMGTGTPSTGALTNNTWTELPAATSQYTPIPGVAGALWSSSTSTGVLTYNGPTRAYLIAGSLTARSNGGTTTNFAFSFSYSGAAIVGTTNNSTMEAQVECAATEENNWSFFGGITTVSTGSTVQGVVRNIDDTEALIILRYQLMMIPAF